MIEELLRIDNMNIGMEQPPTVRNTNAHNYSICACIPLNRGPQLKNEEPNIVLKSSPVLFH